MSSAFKSSVSYLGAEVAQDRAPIRAAGARRRGLLSVLVIMTIATLSFGSLFGYINNTVRQSRQNTLLTQIRDARILLGTVAEARAAMRGYVLTVQPSYLRTYYRAVGALRGEAEITFQAIDTETARGSDNLSRQLAQEQALWDAIIAQAASGAQLAAVERLGAQIDKSGMTTLNDVLNRFIDKVSAQWEANRSDLTRAQNIFLILNASGGVGTILALAYAFRRSGAEAVQREDAMRQAVRSREAAIASREEVRKIFAMAQALQSADGLADGAAILRAGAIGLLPRIGGALYTFNALRDRLDIVTAWSPDPEDQASIATVSSPVPFLLPQECWALKRNKPHLNGDGPDALRCCHAPPTGCSLEVPMIGRGEPVGLLILSDYAPGSMARLTEATDIACVLADSMSLGLSSIMLRDKLRDQAVRDSLTGLHNRRFLEEMLQTLSLQAQRRHASLAAIMIDLDHFKRLNDEHGHAMGDAVLKLVAATLLAALRASDVACRYGGEELVVLLPDCTLEMARAKAEQIRDRIARLSRENGPTISASLGVSAIPGAARDTADLLTSADAALYRAKEQGRNRVAVAPQLLQPAGILQGQPEWGATLVFPAPIQDTELGITPA